MINEDSFHNKKPTTKTITIKIVYRCFSFHISIIECLEAVDLAGLAITW